MAVVIAVLAIVLVLGFFLARSVTHGLVARARMRDETV
jgi:HAMP domain-containing protein